MFIDICSLEFIQPCLGGGSENDIAISSSFHHSLMCRLNGCVFVRGMKFGFFLCEFVRMKCS